MALRTGSTYRFALTATLDDAVWNISGATITLQFRRPDGTSFDRTGTIVSASAGTARYDCVTTDLDQAGTWTRSWTVSQSGVVLESAPIFFFVESAP